MEEKFRITVHCNELELNPSERLYSLKIIKPFLIIFRFWKFEGYYTSFQEAYKQMQNLTKRYKSKILADYDKNGREIWSQTE